MYNLPVVVDTQFGKYSLGSFGSYQLTLTEYKISFTSSSVGIEQSDGCFPRDFPAYPFSSLDDLNESLVVPHIQRDQSY